MALGVLEFSRGVIAAPAVTSTRSSFIIDVPLGSTNLLSHTILWLELMLCFTAEIGLSELEKTVSVYDIKRIQSYSRNILEYHAIMDLLPSCMCIQAREQSCFNPSHQWRGCGLKGASPSSSPPCSALFCSQLDFSTRFVIFESYILHKPEYLLDGRR